MTTDAHKRKQGCPKCMVRGWSKTSWELQANKSKDFDSFKVYIIECFNENERFIKIGRTFRPIEKRFHSTLLPYKYKIITILVFQNSKKCFEKEVELHTKYSEYKYTPCISFNGDTECFHTDVLKTIHIKTQLEI